MLIRCFVSRTNIRSIECNSVNYNNSIYKNGTCIEKKQLKRTVYSFIILIVIHIIMLRNQFIILAKTIIFTYFKKPIIANEKILPSFIS